MATTLTDPVNAKRNKFITDAHRLVLKHGYKSLSVAIIDIEAGDHPFSAKEARFIKSAHKKLVDARTSVKKNGVPAAPQLAATTTTVTKYVAPKALDGMESHISMRVRAYMLAKERGERFDCGFTPDRHLNRDQGATAANAIWNESIQIGIALDSVMDAFALSGDDAAPNVDVHDDQETASEIVQEARAYVQSLRQLVIKLDRITMTITKGETSAANTQTQAQAAD